MVKDKAKIVTVTGIAKGGSAEFCEKYASQNQNTRVYDTGDMVYHLAQPFSQSEGPKIPEENILNIHPDTLTSLRGQAFAKIKDQLEEEVYSKKRILIDTHAQFFWDHVYYSTNISQFLKEIPVDMFMTVIDKPSAIKERQMQIAHGQTQNHDLRDLLLWQNVEANTTREIASFFDKPMYVFSRRQNPSVVNSLLDNSFLIYSSFPMTDASLEETEKINKFKQRLRGLRKKIDEVETPIIDPADIDVESGKDLPKKIKSAVDYQTIHRDLNWDITQSTHVVAYYPSDRVDLSKGVSDECTKAMQTGKYVYVICPRKRLSPFMDIAHKVFRDEEKFLKFFKPHMEQSLEQFKRKDTQLCSPA
tara:strand:+ start:597 stop:1679 length:1083 start_codon:yes stop_codon:yes gene_type:complete